MPSPKKMVFTFGEVSMTFTPNDIDAVWREWEAKHPGRRADLEMTRDEFSKACVERLKANARPTRTVLHN